MNVETSQTGSTAVAAVSGRVDSANAKEFEEELSAIIDKGATGLVVDCGELNYISSAGLRVFLIAIRKTSAAGGGLALCRVPDHINEVLEISGFSRLAKVFETVEEARDSFG
ncbi:MAG: STAS domain-containing protein [Gemmatimonadaceae bacterium]|nr:STAS domain-containing protein [Gemmatimonadaceae bacterium]